MEKPMDINRSLAVPRQISEGVIPLINVEGKGRDCGYEYGRLMLERYPHYTNYFHMALRLWTNPDKTVLRLFEKYAPHIVDVYKGILEAVKKTSLVVPTNNKVENCTSFSVSPNFTLDNIPISGQNKDTGINSIELYIILRMKVEDAPTILTLAYPGEILGYGMWSTGMTIFRNSLHSIGNQDGLDMQLWGILALAQNNVHDAAELALKYGLRESGNVLISDKSGCSVNVEFNRGGVNVIEAKDGISVHANHPVGTDTFAYEDYPNTTEKENSRFRMKHLRELLHAEKHRLTSQKAMQLLANHDEYPLGICRHIINNEPTTFTTAAIVADPTHGLLHVSRGNPCCNWPVSYKI